MELHKPTVSLHWFLSVLFLWFLDLFDKNEKKWNEKNIILYLYNVNTLSTVELLGKDLWCLRKIWDIYLSIR